MTRGQKMQLSYTRIGSKNTIFTAVSGYCAYIVAGTDTGNILIISPNSPDAECSITHHSPLLSGIPIKTLRINIRHGLLLAADGSTFSFKISPLALSSPNFDLSLKKTPFPPCSSIALTPLGDYAAAFSPSGQVFISDLNFPDFSSQAEKSGNILNFKIRISACAMVWAEETPSREPTLICVNDNTVGVWTPLSQSVRVFKLPELSRCGAIAFGYSALLAACPEGIFEFPALSNVRGTFPLLVGRGTLTEFRPTKTSKGAIVITHKPPATLLGPDPELFLAAGDEDEKFISVAGKGKILLLNRGNGKWFQPLCPPLSARALVWMGKSLCVLSFDSSALVYKLLFLKPKPPNSLILEHTAELRGKPGPIAADDRSCAISFPSSGFVALFNSSYLHIRIPMPKNSKIIHMTVDTRAKQIICLLSSRQLISLPIPPAYFAKISQARSNSQLQFEVFNEMGSSDSLLSNSHSKPTTTFSTSASNPSPHSIMASNLLSSSPNSKLIGNSNFTSNQHLNPDPISSSNPTSISQERNIEEKTWTIIAEGVSNFFLDHNFGVLFVVRGLKVQIAGLAGKTGLSPFQETSSVPIGLFGSCSTLLLLPRNARPPFSPETYQFFDLSIVSEMSNPQRAAATIMPMQNSPSFRGIVRQVAVFSLREKLGQECVAFLNHFPKHRKEALASALRAVETPERRGVFQALGPCSAIFADFAHLDVIRPFGGGNLVSFIPSKHNSRNSQQHSQILGSETLEDIKIAALLLPVIMEEEGPTIGFPAALFILSKLHETEDYIDSLVRFLDPLLSPPVKRPDGKMECVGMILETGDYRELKRRLDLTLDDCLLDLFRKYEPTLAALLAKSTQTSLSSFFNRHPRVDVEFTLTGIFEHLAAQPIEESEKKVYKTIYPFAKSCGWPIWGVALMLLVGDKTEAGRTLDENPRVKKQFQGSPWKHLMNP